MSDSSSSSESDSDNDDRPTYVHINCDCGSKQCKCVHDSCTGNTDNPYVVNINTAPWVGGQFFPKPEDFNPQTGKLKYESWNAPGYRVQNYPNNPGHQRELAAYKNQLNSFPAPNGYTPPELSNIYSVLRNPDGTHRVVKNPDYIYAFKGEPVHPWQREVRSDHNPSKRLYNWHDRWGQTPNTHLYNYNQDPKPNAHGKMMQPLNPALYRPGGVYYAANRAAQMPMPGSYRSRPGSAAPPPVPPSVPPPVPPPAPAPVPASPAIHTVRVPNPSHAGNYIDKIYKLEDREKLVKENPYDYWQYHHFSHYPELNAQRHAASKLQAALKRNHAQVRYPHHSQPGGVIQPMSNAERLRKALDAREKVLQNIRPDSRNYISPLSPLDPSFYPTNTNPKK